VAGGGPKKHDTDKLHFFKVEPGEKTGAREPVEIPGDDPMTPMAPVFPTFDSPGSSTPDDAQSSEPPGGDLEPLGPNTGTYARLEPAEAPSHNAGLEVQLDLLKDQVASLSKMSEGDRISGNQVEILKKYLALKESEVRDLRDQQEQYQSVLRKLSSQVDTLQRNNRDLVTEMDVSKRHEKKTRDDVRDVKTRYQDEMAVLKADYEERLRSSGNYDAQAEDLHRKKEEWKDKVREELKRVKLKEKELETKHELLRRDTQALLDSKDKHLLELTKKSDALEMEMEALEDRLRRSNVVLSAIDSRKKRLIETMRLAIALLESIDSFDHGLDDNERKAG